MFVLVRAVIWATLFVSFLLVFVPSRILSSAGIAPPDGFGSLQVAGMILVAVGSAVAISCILTFVFVGKGTAAPFDPPRRLVVNGPYRFVRNPMYIGAGVALVGAAMFYWSWQLVAYLLFLWIVVHILAVTYEEPTLRRMFGDHYTAYCARTHRWLPRW